MTIKSKLKMAANKEKTIPIITGEIRNIDNNNKKNSRDN
jgi:hypothetical protein